ncbi:hypothetical protein ACWDTI_06015 [Gordonia sp. NPDC003424]
MTVLDDLDVSEREGTDLDGERPRRGRVGVAGERAGRSKSAQRAIDRRRKRIEKDGDARPAGRVVPSSPKSAVSLRDRVARVPFVIPVIALLVVGLGTSLWLSTKAAQDSYRLGVERQQNQALVDKRDSLKRDYESGDSAPELSDKATKLGMIPASNPPRMIVGADGKPRLVGDPQPAQGKGMRTINPPIGPDPVSTIDPKKVDDSEGLPGGSTDSGTAQPNSTSPAPSTAPAPNAGPTTTSPAPNVGPEAAAPAPGVTAPAPNVLPTTPNAPGAPPTQSR